MANSGYHAQLDDPYRGPSVNEKDHPVGLLTSNLRTTSDGGDGDNRVTGVENDCTYQIIVADAADAVSVNFSGRCKFLQI